MRRDKQGRSLFKRVHIYVEMPGKTRPDYHRFVAPPGKFFHSGGIDEILEHMAELVEKRLPMLEFRLVELASNEFKFILVGLKDYPTLVVKPAEGTPLGTNPSAETPQ